MTSKVKNMNITKLRLIVYVLVYFNLTFQHNIVAGRAPDIQENHHQINVLIPGITLNHSVKLASNGPSVYEAGPWTWNYEKSQWEDMSKHKADGKAVIVVPDLNKTCPPGEAMDPSGECRENWRRGAIALPGVGDIRSVMGSRKVKGYNEFGLSRLASTGIRQCPPGQAFDAKGICREYWERRNLVNRGI